MVEDDRDRGVGLTPHPHLECRGPRKSRAIHLLALRACVAYKRVKTYTEGWDSSVGMATGYGLDGPGIESPWGRDFPPFQTGPGAHPASCTMGTWSFPG